MISNSIELEPLINVSCWINAKEREGGNIVSSFNGSGSSKRTNQEPDTSKKTTWGMPTKDQGKTWEYQEEQRIKPEE